eukprot:TRINITY_DN1367_c0_g1_i2.p1 TRINITY_DN1367_c0_g1~~TRINITY_DN1367_c0_g1_i2.p1  ORF type:complete len:338 (-),score=91.59 TRINITY_DN1367_c0_g1_i2:296-1309(-)
MKTAAACCLVGLGFAAASDSQWQEFKTTFGKTYATAEQEAHRRGIFEKNVEFIESTNAKNLGYELGVNQFTDLLPDEWSATYFGLTKPATPFGGATYLGRHERATDEALPESVDWTSKGAVTPVKNQGQCGSCWAFSTTGSLEGANQLATGKLVSLSEQQFVDCAGGFGNQGCNGGLMDNAFKYAETVAICTEDSYSYKAASGSCQASSCTEGLPAKDVTGYKDVATNSKEDLMSAVAQQPVSIAIEADLPIFQSYKSGVLSGMCGAKLDHGVLVVGYGTDPDGGDYWKVKNSWGTSYGEEGYVRLKRGKGGSGECGILSQPSYPEVKKAEADAIVV